MSIVTTVKLNFAQRLKNKIFRRKFFRTSAQDAVAAQIRELRHKRGMRQIDLAKAARMKQSAISRLEQAEYSRWGFNTLMRIADSLDARARIVFEAAEDVIAEYEQQERQRAELAARFEKNQKSAAAGVPRIDQLTTLQEAVASSIRATRAVGQFNEFARALSGSPSVPPPNELGPLT